MNRKWVFWALSVLATYAVSFGMLWRQTRSFSPPKRELTAQEHQTLADAESFVSLEVQSAEKDAARISARVGELRSRLTDISENSGFYGDEAGPLLSDAQLTLNNQVLLERTQGMLLGELKLCNLAIKGLQGNVGRREVLETLEQIETWSPKIGDSIDETDRAITKTKLGLGGEPADAPELARFQWQQLKLTNLEQNTNISEQRQTNTDLGKATGPLKRLAERAPVTYHTLRFPF